MQSIVQGVVAAQAPTALETAGGLCQPPRRRVYYRLAPQRHPRVTVHMGAALDVDARLLHLCHVRYREALAGRPAVEPRDTLLLLVGRGSSDPDANGNIAKVARFLQEGYPTAWAAC